MHIADDDHVVALDLIGRPGQACNRLVALLGEVTIGRHKKHRTLNRLLAHEQVLEINGRNRRSVWSVNTQAFAGAHCATFPPKLIEPCILASTRPGDYVLDPFFGSGTVGVVCEEWQRKYIGIELHPLYVELAAARLEGGEDTVVKMAV